MVGLLRICVAVSDVSDRRFGSRTVLWLVRATTLTAKDRVVLEVWNVAGGVRAAEANLDQAGRMEKSRVRNFTTVFSSWERHDLSAPTVLHTTRTRHSNVSNCALFPC